MTSLRTWLLLTCLVPCLTLPQLAVSADPPETSRASKEIQALLNRLDKNEDGVISRDEWRDPDLLLLKRLDKNKDGKLSKRERFLALDKNRDGQLSLDEKSSPAARTLRRLDRNKDGIISSDEAPEPYERFELLDVNGDGYVSPVDALL